MVRGLIPCQGIQQLHPSSPAWYLVPRVRNITSVQWVGYCDILSLTHLSCRQWNGTLSLSPLEVTGGTGWVTAMCAGTIHCVYVVNHFFLIHHHQLVMSLPALSALNGAFVTLVIFVSCELSLRKGCSVCRLPLHMLCKTRESSCF